MHLLGGGGMTGDDGIDGNSDEITADGDADTSDSNATRFAP